jgi:hypothetical protein
LTTPAIGKIVMNIAGGENFRRGIPRHPSLQIGVVEPFNPVSP